jgi:hypothetical protein
VLSTVHQQQCSVQRKRESAFLPQKESITHILGMSKMANPNDPADWFYKHCSSHHYSLETAMPMLDVAVFIMEMTCVMMIFLSDPHCKNRKSSTTPGTV